ncbi:MAG: Uma2 family endonuclease [Planctomycetota bacterium]
MPSAQRLTPQYTIEDYEQWQGDWELWDGTPVSMSPSPSKRHQRTAKRLLYMLEHALGEQTDCQCEVFYEIDWRVKDDTVLRPDLLIECEPADTKWVESTPTLVVEILSPGTAKNDQFYKRGRYAQYGVGYYLIVDPIAESIESLHLIDGQYQPIDPTKLKLGEGCSISLDTSAIWS